MSTLAQTTVSSPIGHIQITASEQGVKSVLFATELELGINIKNVHLQQAELELKQYFLGDRKNFQITLDMSGYTPFQEEVWKTLQQIPFGHTRSYLDLSKTLGDRKKIRAVANANAKNPFLILVPCHRVIGSSGDLVGYRGGLEIKRWLLTMESSQKTLF